MVTVQKQKLKKPDRQKTKTTSKSNKGIYETRKEELCSICWKREIPKNIWYVHGNPVCKDCCLSITNSFLLDVDLSELVEQILFLVDGQTEVPQVEKAVEDTIRVYFSMLTRGEENEE